MQIFKFLKRPELSKHAVTMVTDFQRKSSKLHCYIASVNTKRDWLICSHVALDKCNVSRPGNK